MPICLHYLNTYNKTGQISFIPHTSWQQKHLSDKHMGYDTLMINNYKQNDNFSFEDFAVKERRLPIFFKNKNIASNHFSIKGKLYSSNCKQSPIEAILDYNFENLRCIIYKRVYFYFGSYAGLTYMSGQDNRVFSASLLILNSLIFIASLYFFYLQIVKKNLFFSFIYCVALLSFLQALLIIPEQRFVIMPMIIFWLSFFNLIILLLNKLFLINSDEKK